MESYIDRQVLYRHFTAHPSVCTDSRALQRGDIFFALSGPSFDGNDFALQALNQGAAYAVVSRPELAEQDDRCLLVKDTLRALQELAYTHRMNLDMPVIAITGTNGKTTTKELCHIVLNQKYNVLATEGNLNNHIGVPLTLLKITKQHGIALIEMGASGPDEIKLLSSIAQPTAGLITNIGKAHLEGFGSIEGVLSAKSELPEHLVDRGKPFFLNNDDLMLRGRWQDKAAVKYGTEGSDVSLDVMGRVESDQPFLTMICRANGMQETIETRLTGRYNYQNVLAAVTVGTYFGVDAKDIKNAIEGYAPTNNRSQVVRLHRDINVIMDAYNANPSSMKVALENLSLAPEERKMAILGDMKELGAASREEHQALVSWLNEHPEIAPILCGVSFKEVAPSDWCTFEETSELLEYLKSLNLPDDMAILVKGSRRMALEKCLTILEESALRETPGDGCTLWISKRRQ